MCSRPGLFPVAGPKKGSFLFFSFFFPPAQSTPFSSPGKLFKRGNNVDSLFPFPGSPFFPLPKKKRLPCPFLWGPLLLNSYRPSHCVFPYPQKRSKLPLKKKHTFPPLFLFLGVRWNALFFFSGGRPLGVEEGGGVRCPLLPLFAEERF